MHRQKGAPFAVLGPCLELGEPSKDWLNSLGSSIMNKRQFHNPMSALLLSILVATAFTNLAQAADEERVQLTITGGHGTDPRDHGRPVVLIANALGVPPEVFREAFSHVSPAPAGTEPGRDQVQQNKRALLDALSCYGVTNALLDRVSDYYRYRPESDRLWPTKPATGYAIIKNGSVNSVTVVNGGAGYSSPPQVTIPGHPEVRLKAVLSFGRDLATNGSVSAITVEKTRQE
jgi:hypothetical protein